MPTDDHSLVQRARSGDERAFRTLVERYQKKVYAVALGMVKDREEAMDVVQEALEQIPEKHRAILLLRELDGLSYEELAQVLEIPKGTVMSRLFHARAKVQKLLSESLGIPLPAEGEED